MKPFFSLSAALALVSGLAVAEPVTYDIDPTHTYPRFSYSHLGLSSQTSQFNQTSGTVTLDKSAGTGKVDIVIDMTSVETGYVTFNEHIQGEDFFDTARHPEAVFQSSQVNFQDGRPVSIDGHLTLKGVTLPVTLEVTHFAAMTHPMLERPAIGAHAHTVVKRSDFSADKFVPYVSDEVTISISLEAVVPE
ncbi:YceI family protein [Ectothiorhodospira lacustris]|uniref:YceI family protein n=1 Tax=Ectothiorhodospira lacustris TaxID=2899127 RepID=UPI001EE879B5|nr:YceI family protein [Ectothiorhodospira lacustris]MCG5510154.1 YceI family protein [Ectothiorhodospira lacustris]MCG5521997.1 YceI family protein [Ectothiorhodospira lacustris]